MAFKLAGQNTSLERQSKGCGTLLMFSMCFLLIDVWKQVTIYGVKYYNNGTYIIPLTQIVAIIETIKFVMFFVFVILRNEVKDINFSPWYIIPSLMYVLNNNLFFYVLHYTTPPIWNILVQLRIVTTALIYRTVFMRHISCRQWIAIFLLIIAVIFIKETVGLDDNSKVPVSVQVIAVGVILMITLAASMIGTLTMEYLYKNDSQSFGCKQTQLYLYSSIGSWLLHGFDNSAPAVLTGDFHRVYGFLVACIVLSCLAGVVIALIVMKLDNIVKQYTQALSTTLTSIACAVFFPEHFTLSINFFLCFLLMLYAVFLYESKSTSVFSLISYTCNYMKMRSSTKSLKFDV